MRHLTHDEFEGLKDMYLEDRLTPDEEQSIERHLDTCDRCKNGEALARKFAEAFRKITEDERTERKGSGGAAQENDPSRHRAMRSDPGSAGRRPHGLFIARSVWARAIAASVLVVLSGAGGWALASRSENASMALQTSSAFDHGTVRSLRRPTRFAFGETGIPDHAPDLGRTSFIDHTGDMGTVLVVGGVESPGLDLCAFNADGSLAWQASRSWTDWAALLRHPDLRVEGLKCVVAAGRSPSPTETALLSLRHERQSCLLMIEPQSGHLVGRLFYEGQFSVDDAQFEAIAAMPQVGEGSRRMMIAARRMEAERSMPTLLVCDHDGTPRQHLGFPLLGTEDPLKVRVWHIRTIWSSTRPEVTVATSEDLYFSLLVRNQLLDTGPDSVLAALGDPAIPAYERLHGKGAFEVLSGGPWGSDGYRQYLRTLAASVKVLSLDLGPQQWERVR